MRNILLAAVALLGSTPAQAGPIDKDFLANHLKDGDAIEQVSIGSFKVGDETIWDAEALVTKGEGAPYWLVVTDKVIPGTDGTYSTWTDKNGISYYIYTAAASQQTPSNFLSKNAAKKDLFSSKSITEKRINGIFH